MVYSRCDACGGSKTILGLGGIRKDCSVCKGVGFVAIKNSAEQPVKEKKKKLTIKKGNHGPRKNKSADKGIAGHSGALGEQSIGIERAD